MKNFSESFKHSLAIVIIKISNKDGKRGPRTKQEHVN